MSQPSSIERSITFPVFSVGLLLGTIGLVYAYWSAKDSLRYTVGSTFQELARQSAENAGLLLTKEIEWVEQVSALPILRAAVKEGTSITFDHPELRRVREEQQRYFTSMMIVGRQGQAIGGGASEATRAYYRRQPWWPVVFEDGRAWGGALNRSDDGRWYWEVAVPIRDDNGTVAGALKVVIGREHFLDSVLRGRIGRTGHVMLLDNDGAVIACPLRAPSVHTRLTELTPDPSSTGTARLVGPVWRELGVDTHQERGGIVGVAPVRLRPDIAWQGNWAILVQQDPDEIYAPLVSLTERLALFGVGAIGLIAALRWRLARRIAKPITELMERMRGLTVPLDPPAGAPREPVGIREIDALSASFEDLAARLDRAARASRQTLRDLERANDELARSEEHYRMLWNHSVHLLMLVDAEGVVRDLNRRGEIKLWRAASDVVGTSVFSLFCAEDQPKLRALLNEVFASGRERAVEELRVPSPTGDCFTMEMDLVPLEKKGAVEAVMVQLTDWTEKKELQEQLLRTERLASLSHFASMFAHDIRNPLAGVKKTLELMAGRQELQGEPVRGWCEDLRFTIELLQGMINDMLDIYQEHYSGLPLITSDCSAGEVVREVVRLFRIEAEARGIVFDVRLPDGDIPVQADRRRIERVLINLVHNAIKFSPPRGTIVITVGLNRADGRAGTSAESSRERDLVRISVSDDGPGVDPQELPHLFETFFRQRDRRDGRIGRGLGLYFCRLVAEAHHGRILASNRPNGGAEFVVELPVWEVSHVGHLAHR
jgi:PAS domain S-box-containing protein